MPTFNDLIQGMTPFRFSQLVAPVTSTTPVTPPPQPGAQPTTITPSTSASTTSGSAIPDFNNPFSDTSMYAKGLDQVYDFLKSKGLLEDPSAIVSRIQKEWGPYDVTPPNPQDYQLPKTQGLGWSAIGALFSPYAGEYMKGAMAAQQQQEQSGLNQLRARQDYDTALRNWQQGKATWKTDMARAISEAQAANRNIIASFLPYTGITGNAAENAAVRGWTAGLGYLYHEQVLGYDYLKESNLQAYRQGELGIRQQVANQLGAYRETMAAVASGNQVLAQQKLQILAAATNARIQQEQAMTQKALAEAASLPLDKATAEYQRLDNEYRNTTYQLSQLDTPQNESNPAMLYLIQGLQAHQQAVQREMQAVGQRIEQLQRGQGGQPSTPTSPTPGAPGNLRKGTYQGRPAVTDGVHVWDANTYELLK